MAYDTDQQRQRRNWRRRRRRQSCRPHAAAAAADDDDDDRPPYRQLDSDLLECVCCYCVHPWFVSSSAILNRENVSNSLVMIQPMLMSYCLDAPTQPVMLDVSSLAPNRILMLDTFFHVVIWYGDTIDKWRRDNVHLNPQYAYFAELLKAPATDAKTAMDTRFPYPRFIECVERGSQSRFLMAKLNPSITQSTTGEGGEPPVFTEDVSLKVFMQHLRRLAVAPQS